MPGLQEHVEYVKTPFRRGVAGSSGVTESIEELHRRDWEAWVARHGAVSLSVANHLAALRERGADETAVVRIGIWFEGPRAVGSAVDADMAARAATVMARAEALTQRSAEPLARWQAMGFQVRRQSARLPVVFGDATPDVVERLARDPDVRRVTLDERGESVLHSAPNFVRDPHTDQVNALGHYALKERVGIIEAAYCGIYDGHESMSFGAVTHSHPPPSGCAHDAECDNYAAGSVCKCSPDGRCVAEHESEVASVLMGAKDGEPWGAAQAHLFIYNPPVAPDVRCSPSDMDEGYDWLVKHGVTTVNQSWSCYSKENGHHLDEDGLVQDYYIRQENLFVTKAAGNQWLGFDEPACPATLNSLCVGASNGGGMGMWSYGMNLASSWHNPVFPNADGYPVVSDREEPDLVARGNVSDVMGLASDTHWILRGGTSYSAPVLAQIGAILKEACGYQDPRTLRSLLQVASGNRNPDAHYWNGWKYSTPNEYTDWHDGAGGIETPFAYAFCGSGDDDWDTDAGYEDIDLRQGGSAPPSGSSPSPSDPPPGERAYLPGDHQSRKVRVMGSFNNRVVQAGQRIRASIAWHACPPDMYQSSVAPSAVATDFDLLLYTPMSGGEYIYMSQSVDDSTEGFDVTVAATGRYSIYIAWPDGNQGCEQNEQEGIGWAWAISKN